MHLLRCDGPIWSDGRVAECVQLDFLGFLVPSVVCVVSAAFLVGRLTWNRLRPERDLAYKLLASSAQAVALPNGSFGDGQDAEREAPGELGECAGFATSSPRPRFIAGGCRWSAAVEGLALATDMALNVALIAHVSRSGPDHSQTPSSLVAILSSAYMLSLVLLRASIVGASPGPFCTLGSHSMAIYFVQWLCTLVSAHSVVDRVGMPHMEASLLRVAIFSLLLLLHATAPRQLTKPFCGDDTDRLARPVPEETASLASRLTLSWVASLVWQGYSTILESHDLWDLARDQKSASLAPSFRQMASATVPLLQRLLKYFKGDILLQGWWAALMSVMLYVPAQLLRGILGYVESPDTMRASTAWLLVVGLLISGLLTGLADAQCEWTGLKVGAKLKGILISEIYAKTLRRKMTPAPSKGKGAEGPTKQHSAQHASDGSVLNLMAIDAAIVSDVSAYLHLLWISVPGQVIIATCMLYSILGVSGIFGVMFMVALLPVYVALSKRQAGAQHQALGAADTRVQTTTELISSVRLIKYYAWEACFQGRVSKLRQEELKKLRSRFIWWSASMTACYSMPLIIAIVTLFFYTVVAGNPLETSVAFPALAVFAVLRVPLDRVSDMISFVLQAHVSIIRINEFLNESETDKYFQLSQSQADMIGFEDATFKWFGDDPKRGCNETDPLLEPPPPFRLRDLRIKFLPGGLNVVIGHSGSGKSSLLLALLGEMELLSGRVHLPLGDASEPRRSAGNPFNLSNTAAYCPQVPWIQNKTVRENITFGLPFDYRRYRAVLHAVALLPDLPLLHRGDLTLAGENGARLSGGQRQRVALARALYSRAKLVLLDDCLSALDAATARHVFVHAIKGSPMEGRTCILATHQTRLVIPYCDHAISLEDGKIKAQGTPAALVARRVLSADILTNAEDLFGVSTDSESVAQTNNDEEAAGDIFLHKNFSRAPTSKDKETSRDYEEDKFTGAVSWPAVKLYMSSMGRLSYWLVILCAFSAQQLMALGLNLCIKEWASRGIVSSPGQGYYLGIYAGMAVAFVLVSFTRDAITFYGSMKASKSIHERLLSAIFHAKFRFFDRTPIGQITNRFAKDIQTMDQELSPYCVSTLQILANLVMVITLISAVLPAFLLVVAVICLAYAAIGAVYVSSARDLKRIAAIERSPLYQHFGETLSGNVSIRAYGQVAAFTDQGYDLTDNYNRPNVLLCASREWLTFRVTCLSAVISSMTGAFVLWGGDAISVGAAGLVLTYAMTFTENVLFLVQLYALSQQSFNSVERIKEYMDIEQEPAGPVKELPDPTYSWPRRGNVRFRNFATRYGPDQDPVLNHLDLEIAAGRRVAIVGRTGAGKSTLGLALIRGLEAAEGLIELDSIDIASLGLDLLRRLVTVIPQDPILFKGSLRENLDPEVRYSDEEIYEVLQSVRLSRILPSLDLDDPVPALSQGQRQLICIARALLRKSLVLVLDEATASVDPETDQLIQASLRDSIAAGTTVMTIAHRLLSIADYDRVVVMAAGRVIEDGSPERLLEKDEKEDAGAVFRKMCVQSGELQLVERLAGLRT
ncbi:ATP-dependent bile acid permease [Tolypocladium capitatum]|uniref:ATP-dependent bile acid permease n=1 Tax=Tolypocladium capitatum TaxID=45235 RepID=A0A2K3QIZ2_9HYPO|nr:ATP-dependent bile acid permease [Tolypocladium capitatum]